MFDALIEMMNLDLITFTDTYDNKGYLTLLKEEDGELKEEIHRLSFEEELALMQIDLAKEELVNMYRYDGTNNNYRYDLSPEKEGKMHDDRSYCIAMLAWYLQELRRKNITEKKRYNNQSLEGLSCVSAVNFQEKGGNNLSKNIDNEIDVVIASKTDDNTIIATTTSEQAFKNLLNQAMMEYSTYNIQNKNHIYSRILKNLTIDKVIITEDELDNLATNPQDDIEN